MAKLTNRRHERFAQLVAKGGRSPEAAYRAIYKAIGKTAAIHLEKLLNKTEVAIRIKEILAQHEGKHSEANSDSRFLTFEQKREFLARVVNTPAGEVDEKSPLCQRAESAGTASRAGRKKLNMPDKLKALELDAKLAGELRVKHEIAVAERRASAVELQARLEAATPLLQARLAKEGK